MGGTLCVGLQEYTGISKVSSKCCSSEAKIWKDRAREKKMKWWRREDKMRAKSITPGITLPGTEGGLAQIMPDGVVVVWLLRLSGSF